MGAECWCQQALEKQRSPTEENVGDCAYSVSLELHLIISPPHPLPYPSSGILGVMGASWSWSLLDVGGGASRAMPGHFHVRRSLQKKFKRDKRVLKGEVLCL